VLDRAPKGADMIDNFDDVFEGTASVQVQAREYHKIPGDSDQRGKYDEI
jgi:hypothetical protein